MVRDRKGVCLVQGLIVELNKWMVPQYLKQGLAHVGPPLLFDRMHPPAWRAGLGEGGLLGWEAGPPLYIQPCVGGGGAGKHYLRLTGFMQLFSCLASASTGPWPSGCGSSCCSCCCWGSPSASVGVGAGAIRSRTV